MSLSAFTTMSAALLVVLGLMAGLAWVLKRAGLAGPVGAQGAKKRLKIIEILTLSAQHRAVLLRCDAVEHLIVIGPQGQVVVENGIKQDE